MMTKEQMVTEVRRELTEHLIPFWEGLKDPEYGGFYGYMDYDLKLDPKAEKGCILNSRICWFFSKAYLTLHDPALLSYAKHAYDFMKDRCFDRTNGGIYWSITYDGKPYDTTKHTYNQAFSIYALSEYYEASGDREALDLAFAQYHLIEAKMRDEGGYLEALDEKFQPVVNDKLSENGVIADRTMNTLLHVLEGYTNLLRVSGDEEVRGSLKEIFRTFVDHVWNPELHRQEVFFDHDWHTLIDLYSYGHDIETSWLMDHSLDVVADPSWTAKIRPIMDDMADNLLKAAFDGRSLPAECEKGVVKENRVWWVQAETVLGYLNAYGKHPEREDYRDAAVSEWEFIRDYLVDKREGSEWYWELNKDGTPIPDRPILEPWKCPYHNGRMCMEVLRRLGPQ